MTRGWVAFAGMVASASLCHGLPASSRRFTPQAVVVAKTKLLDIAKSSDKKRRTELVETLENLLTDFGVQSPRLAAHELLEGDYRRLHALSKSDRVALAPVMADLAKLFAEESGLAGRIKAKTATLFELQKDENPTVAKRASWLIRFANGRPVDGYSQHTVTAAARSFLHRGRAGLIGFGDITRAQKAQLRGQWSALTMLAKDVNPFVAERAKLLMLAIQGGDTGTVSPEQLRHITAVFLERGRAGLLNVHGAHLDLPAELHERLSELEAFSQDTTPIVAERARMLIAMANGQSGLLKKETLDLMARAFLKDGRAGLVDYRRLSDDRFSLLLEKIPELTVLARDENPIVKKRASSLIRLARQEPNDEFHVNTLVRYFSAFLERGREGLAQPEHISEELAQKLNQSLPELERLTIDKNPIVSRWANVLIRVAAGQEVDVAEGNLRTRVVSFIKRGRAGLLMDQRMSEKRRAALLEKMPELERLANDPDPTVAKRARLLVRAIVEKEQFESDQTALVSITGAFLKRGRNGLLDYQKISKRKLAKLVLKKEEVGRFTADKDPLVASRAKALMHAINTEQPAEYSAGWLGDLISAFLNRGRNGLVDMDEVSEKKVGQLVEKRQELGLLALNENAAVADQAKILIKVANRESVPDLSGFQLRQLTDAFLTKGQSALLVVNRVGDALRSELSHKQSELERLTKDEDPLVAKRAGVLIQVIKREKRIKLQDETLKMMATAFLKQGRDGLIGDKGITDKQIAKLVERLPLLSSLAMDKNERVAKRARALIRAAKREPVTDYSRGHLRTLASRFLNHGRPGLLGVPRQVESEPGK